MKDDKAKMFTYIKRLLVVLVVAATIFGGSASFWIDESKFNEIKDGTEQYLELENDVVYELQYLCMAKQLDAIVYFIGNSRDNTGTITVSVTDMNGEYYAPEYTFDLTLFDEEILRLPTYMVQNPKIGHFYIFRIIASGTKEDQPLTIQCAKSRNLISFMKGNTASLKSPIVLTCLGSEFFCAAYAGIIAILFLFVVGLALFDKKFRITKIWGREILIISVSVGAVLVTEIASGNVSDIIGLNYLKNIFLVYIIIKVLGLFIKMQSVVLCMISIFGFVAGTAEHYIMEFRGTPLAPWDFKVLDTAVTVAGSYQYTLSMEILVALEILICLMLVITKFDVSIDKKHRYLDNIMEAVWVLACAAVFKFAVVPSLDANLWSLTESYQKQGILVSFLSYAQYLKYQKPEGYSEKKCQELLDGAGEIEGEGTKAKNIIVIMNESFSDLRVINDQIISDEYMPFIDSLTDNVIKGNLYVPVFGAGTSNTEFEVLTGVSTRYTPPTPYVTSINTDIDSLCNEFGSMGFHSLAFHPYVIENWNRNRVYPHLGFDTLLSWDDMESLEFVRWCVSDRCNYQEVIRRYEENDSDLFFMFNVTMQNHGGYAGEFENFSDTVDLSELGEFPKAETYLSLLKESDEAFEELVNYFKDVDSPTLICFFGDHQASIEDEFYETLFGKALDELTMDEFMKRYITPVVIWTNYDMKSGEIDKISTNYLGGLIMKTAGYGLKGYDAFLYELFEKYPVISVNGIYDKDGRYFASDADVNDELLERYKFLQYYTMKTGY